MKKILPLLLLTTTVCAETHLALPTGNAAGNDTQISAALMQQATNNVATASTPSNLSEAEQKKIFEEAKAAYDQGNYARALELYQRLADAGHAEAMGRIGIMYKYGYGVHGYGVARDYASAKEWFEKAGDAGYSDGYRWIGNLYGEGGPGLEQNYATAKKWYEKVIAAGDSLGYLDIGGLYEQGGPGLEQNYASAKRWYEKAIAAGDSDGYGWIGLLYEQGGPGLERDLEQACRYYRKADWQEAAERFCSR